MTTLTMPAPDCPSTSVEASSSCTFFMFSCICCACFIRPASCPFMMSLRSRVAASLSRFDRAHPRAHVDELPHERVVLHRVDRARLFLFALARRHLGGRSAGGRP